MNLLNATALAGTLGVLAVLVALLTALVGAFSFYFNSANTTKQTRLRCTLAAYQAAIAWQGLAELVSESDELNVSELWERVIKARESSTYHEAFLYGESRALASEYHAFSSAIRRACEPVIVDALHAAAQGGPVQRPQPDADARESYEPYRIAYLAAVKKNVSFYRSLRRLHIAPPFGDPPDWL